MKNRETTIKAFEKKGYTVICFETKQQAVDYLRGTIHRKTIGFGGSQTLTELDLRHVLAEDNTVYVPDFAPEGENFVTVAEKAQTADVFLTSANAVSENGEIINIDGYCNRLAGALLPHQKVYYIIGSNKIGGTLEEAIFRARNVAAPKNALRLHCKTPCAMAVMKRLEQEYAEKHPEGFDQLEWQRFIEGLDDEQLGTHCYDCQSPGTIVATHMILAAADEGVNSCWINYFDPDKIAAELGLPENEEVLMVMDLGYAAEGVKPLAGHTQRKELSETVTYL